MVTLQLLRGEVPAAGEDAHAYEQACSVTTSDTFGHFRPLGLKGYAVQRHFWHFFQFVKQNRPKMSLVVTLHQVSLPPRREELQHTAARSHVVLLQLTVLAYFA